jgi:hypothetical protein
MDHVIVLIGVGEMGSVFSHALLRSGHPIIPVLRSTPLTATARRFPEPAVTLVTVGEDDLGQTLDRVPEAWRSSIALIQNELLPRDWLRHGIETPTVAVVWFEKKPGRVSRVIVPTPIAGPGASLLVDALASIGIPAKRIADEHLVETLVVKNLYILTTNIVGMRTGGTVAELWSEHRSLAGAVASEILDIQERLVGAPIDRDRIIRGMVTAFDGDPDHGTVGRSAPRRLERALRSARSAGLSTPYLDAIGREAGLSV